MLNIVGGPDLTLDEVTKAANLIHGVVDYSANIIFGACIDESVQDEVEVTVIATGFPPAGSSEPSAPAQRVTLNVPPQPIPSQNPYGQQSNNPYQQTPGNYAPNPTPYYPTAPVPPVQPVPQPAPQPAPQPVPDDLRASDYDEEDDHDNKLPPFIRRMLGKK